MGHLRKVPTPVRYWVLKKVPVAVVELASATGNGEEDDTRVDARCAPTKVGNRVL